MSDEFYLCANCGIKDDYTYTKLKVGCIPEELAEDIFSVLGCYLEVGMTILESEIESLPVEIQESLDLEEIEYCSNCNEVYDGIMFASTGE